MSAIDISDAVAALSEEAQGGSLLPSPPCTISEEAQVLAADLEGQYGIGHPVWGNFLIGKGTYRDPRDGKIHKLLVRADFCGYIDRRAFWVDEKTSTLRWKIRVRLARRADGVTTQGLIREYFPDQRFLHSSDLDREWGAVLIEGEGWNYNEPPLAYGHWTDKSKTQRRPIRSPYTRYIN